jgi:peptide/nickel transport system permease protein/oligopeptide transport system permease protein
MTGYVVRRILQVIPVFFGTTLLIYLFVYLLPGDPIQTLAGQFAVPNGVEHALRVRYHLDKPFLYQYGYYIWRLLHGDLGQDFSGVSVSSYISRAWPITLKLATTAFAIQVVAGLGLGIVATLRRGLVERLILAGTLLPLIVPVFVLAYVAQLTLGVRWHVFPVAGTGSGWPLSYLLPALLLAFYGLASVTRLTRSSMLENLHADHVRTAYAKGLPGRVVILRHVLRVSLIPVVTLLGLEFGALLSGSIFIEGIFNLPGIGYLIFQGIKNQNGPVVVGVSTLIILVYVFVNLVVDLLYGFLDPRVQLA